MEKDWKLFKKKLGGWQEAYMDRLIEEYKDILNSDAPSFDKYWALRKKIYDDYKSPGVLARDVSRSNMLWILLGLLRDEAITMDDLDEFSDELKEDIKQYINEKAEINRLFSFSFLFYQLTLLMLLKNPLSLNINSMVQNLYHQSLLNHILVLHIHFSNMLCVGTSSKQFRHYLKLH